MKKATKKRPVNQTDHEGPNMRAMTPEPTVFEIPVVMFAERIMKAKSREASLQLAREVVDSFYKNRAMINHRAEERGKEIGKEEMREAFRNMMGIAGKQVVEIR